MFFFVISTNKPMSFGKLFFVKSLPPPIRFQSSRKGKVKPSIRMLDVVNVSSSFFSVNTIISTWFEIRHFNWSNFHDLESMFRFPIITFFRFFRLTYLSAHI